MRLQDLNAYTEDHMTPLSATHPIVLLCLCPIIPTQATTIWTGSPFQSPKPPNQWTQVVQNRGSADLMAFELTLRCPIDGPMTQYDALFNYGHDQPIAPGESVEVASDDPSKCSGGIDAAIFANGQVEGDPARVKSLLEKRRGVADALSQAMPLLSALGKTPVTVQSTIDTLTKNGDAKERLMTAYSVGYSYGCHRVAYRLKTVAVSRGTNGADRVAPRLALLIDELETWKRLLAESPQQDRTTVH